MAPIGLVRQIKKKKKVMLSLCVKWLLTSESILIPCCQTTVCLGMARYDDNYCQEMQP